MDREGHYRPNPPNYYEVTLSDVQAPMDLTAIKFRFHVAKSGNDAGYRPPQH